MLFWASVLNGLLAPVCILLVVVLTSRSDVMGKRVNPVWLKGLGWVSVGVTGTAALAMVATLVWGGGMP
jgi:Mn2+/Fe2+ NRAMP family transporter